VVSELLISQQSENQITVLSDETRIPLLRFCRAFDNVKEYHDIVPIDGESAVGVFSLNNTHSGVDSARDYLKLMPHPLKIQSEGREVFTIFLNVWLDDVSGNKTKQYNKHWNACLQNSGLPGRLLQQEYFVHFYATSPTATVPEILSALRDDLE
jgi:hypothetical protein